MNDGYTGPRPASFSVASARLRWRCNNFRMVMFRPFLLSNAVAAAAARTRGAPRPALRPAVKQAMALCRTMAGNNIRSISTFWDSHPHNQAMAWHAIYFLTQSALVPLVSLLDEPTSEEAREWVSLLQTCVRLLVDMGHITPIGAKCKDAIENLAGGLLRGADDDNDSMLLSKWISEAHSTGAGSTADVDPLIWSSHLMVAGGNGSDDTGFANMVAHPTDPSLTMSLDSASSDGMSAAFDFARGMDTSPGDHRSSIAESVDAWANVAARPMTTTSQWSEHPPSSLPEREFLHRDRIDQWFGLQASHPEAGRRDHNTNAGSMFGTSEPGSSHGAALVAPHSHSTATQSHQAAQGMEWQSAATGHDNWWTVQYKPQDASPSNGFLYNQEAHAGPSQGPSQVQQQHPMHGHPHNQSQPHQHFF